MPPKGKKTKAEEALDFLSNLDNLDAPLPSSESQTISPQPPTVNSTPRPSTDNSRRPDLSSSTELLSPPSGQGEQDEEASKALAFLEAQIAQKRSPLTAPKPTSRATTPNPVPPAVESSPVNVPSSPNSSGWGVSSFWSSAATAIQSAQKMADEGYKRVRMEGVQGVTGQLEQLGVGGVDLNKLRKGAEEKLGGMVKGVDLEKLRHDLMTTTSSTLTTILNNVAPPISAHETLELRLSHPMTGYAGVEGVVYRAWTRILEQTQSGELIVIWSPSPFTSEKEGEQQGRSINPLEGWVEGWKSALGEIEGVKGREEKNPQGRVRAANLSTVAIFLHLQPLLAPLPFPEPPILLSAPSPSPSDSESTPTKHLYFLMTLQDPAHSLRFTTVSQPSPADWLDVEYEHSDWVEERLVEVLRTGVEVIAQDYVATRMGLKQSTGMTRPQTPVGEAVGPVTADAEESKEDQKD